MNLGCPNSTCKVFKQTIFQKKDGFFYRFEDSRNIQRFKCKICQKKYSATTHTLEFRQKKRRINHMVHKLLSTGNSMRNCARTLGVSRHTIDRKLLYLSKKMKQSQHDLLLMWKNQPLMSLQIDDLITSIHTRLKPVSVSVVICSKTYMIVGAKVSEIPAFGKLAQISRKKYGRRQNLHPVSLDQLLKKLKPVIAHDALIETDDHKTYPILIKRNFPNAIHRSYKSQRASVVGMGELKTKSFDPLFAINQTLACFRYGIDRLIRRTWCTSKEMARLQDHIDLFIGYHNERKMKLMKRKFMK